MLCQVDTEDAKCEEEEMKNGTMIWGMTRQQ